MHKMMSPWIKIIPISIIFCLFSILAGAEDQGLNTPIEISLLNLKLTPNEKTWLKTHQSIQIGGPRSFPPFHYFEKEGDLKGISADYIINIMGQLGVKVEVQKNLPWPEVLKRARSGEIDLIPCIAKTAEREAFLSFSSPYLSFPLVIIIRKDASYIGGIEDLHDKKLATIKKGSTNEWLKRDGIKFFPYYIDSPLKGLESVSLGQADARIENLAAATYLIQKNGLTNLKVAAPTPYGNYDLHMAVGKDSFELLSIINKSLEAIPPEKHMQIRNKWLSVRFEYGISKTDVIKWGVMIVLLSASFLTVVLFWNRKLKREVLDRKRAQAELQESKLFNQSVMDNLPIGVAVNSVDPTVNFSYMNDNFPKFYRTTAQALADPDAFWDSVYEDPEYREKIKKRVLDDCASGINGRMYWEDIPITRKGKKTAFICARNTPVPDKQLMISSVWDVTDRKITEEALRKEKEFTETALNSQQDTFFLFEAETGKAIRWNRAFSEATGYCDDEIAVMKAPETYYSAEDLKRAGAFIENVFQTGFGTIELNLICKDGHKIPTEYNVSVIDDNDGISKYLISIGRDLTERKQLELRFQQLAENSTDWIWEFDENNIFTYSSSGVTQLLGYTPEEIIGKSAFDLIPSPEKEKVAREFARSKDYHEPFTSLQNINQHKDGHLVTIESSGSPVFNSNGKFKGYRGIDRDISIRKKMEEELRQSHKMESIGTLAGGIAHDFNNILGIIVGNAELALDDLPDWNPAYDNINEIKTASLRAKDVVRQLLSFSRKTEQEQKPLDISEVIKESIKLIRSSIPSSIEIREELPDKVDTILADGTQIHQILINLCTNASHAMTDGGGLLEIILRPMVLKEKVDGVLKDLSPGNYIKLIIKDSGSGIDPKIHDKIFDPYFTTKEIGKGTGMGLSVVHGIVKNHNGEIYVDSNFGKGVTFTIVFPTIADRPRIDRKVNAAKSKPFGKETILFVDDEKALVDMAKIILEKLGYTVHTSTNPVKALAIFEADPTLFDLIISDMTMPQMSDVKLSEELREIQKDIPIIICTGYSSLINEEEAKDIGISAFAMKPITMSEIAKLIRTVLDK